MRFSIPRLPNLTLGAFASGVIESGAYAGLTKYILRSDPLIEGVNSEVGNYTISASFTDATTGLSVKEAYSVRIVYPY